MAEVGMLVKVLMGRCKGQLAVVVGTQQDAVWIADGRRLKLEKPKRKNPKHIAPAGALLAEQQYATNRQLRRALHTAAQCEGYCKEGGFQLG